MTACSWLCMYCHERYTICCCSCNMILQVKIYEKFDKLTVMAWPGPTAQLPYSKKF